jgi:hypothetical protein
MIYGDARASMDGQSIAAQMPDRVAAGDEGKQRRLDA